MNRTSTTRVVATFAFATLVAACGGGATPTAVPATPTAVPATVGPTGTPTPTAAPLATNVSTGEPSVKAPSAVQPGAQFEVAWTGPNGPRDYITIVKAGATAWTNESYFYTEVGPKGTLQAPIEAGAYELWYVSGASDKVQLKVAITVTPFSATVDGPGEV